MKKCPVCEREYDDNMRFCQTDGTALVDKVEEKPPEPVDPYKTMVASKADIAAAIPPLASSQPPGAPEPSIPAPLENEVLEIPPAADPNKTQVVSEAELRAEMDKYAAEERVIDIPPATEDAPSDIPISGDPSVMPPPSPFSTPSEPPAESPGPANFPTSPPIPSPFSNASAESSVSASEPQPPSPAFMEPEAGINPFERPPASAPLQKAESNPVSTPEPNMQNPQNFGQNAPQSAKQSQTLAIISLVLGILGMTLCCGLLVPSLAALITGFMARGKASNDPANYGGAGLAMGGIITGVIGLLGGLIYLIFIFFFGGLQLLMQNT